MNKLFTKIATAFVGVAMAVGVGVAIGNNSSVREARAEDVTGTIVFGKNDVKIDRASVTGDDDQGNTWTVTTVGTTSFTPNTAYSQVGSSSKPATSITLTTTFEESQTITAFSAKFGGFSGTAGTVTLKVGDTTVGSGSLNASSDVTVNNTNEGTGTILTVTVTGIAKGVKVYNVSYTYSSGGSTSYTLTYDANGGDGTTPTDSNSPYTSGASVTVLGNVGSPALSKFGYAFNGWNESALGTGTSHAVGSTFTISANTTLYAVWNPKTLTGLVTVDGTPETTTYTDADNFDPTGLNIHAAFDSVEDTTRNIASDIVWGALVAGESSVSGTYTHNSVEKSVTISGLTITESLSKTFLPADFTTTAGSQSATKGRVTLSVTNGIRNNGRPDMRAYANSTTTISAAAGYVITNIVFDSTNVDNNKNCSNYSASTGSYSVTDYIGTWTGSASNVDFTNSVQVQMRSVVVTYALDVTTYTVTYNENGATGGSVPTDSSSPYNAGDTVTVLGNTGSLVKTGSTFAGWNTAADGSGDSYVASDTFEISENTILYAVWSVNAASVTVNTSDFELDEQASGTIASILSATVYGSDGTTPATNQNVTWSTQTANVITFDNANGTYVVVGSSGDTTRIYATSVEGSHVSSNYVTLTLTEHVDVYTLTFAETVDANVNTDVSEDTAMRNAYGEGIDSNVTVDGGSKIFGATDVALKCGSSNFSASLNLSIPSDKYITSVVIDIVQGKNVSLNLTSGASEATTESQNISEAGTYTYDDYFASEKSNAVTIASSAKGAFYISSISIYYSAQVPEITLTPSSLDVATSTTSSSVTISADFFTPTSYSAVVKSGTSLTTSALNWTNNTFTVTAGATTGVTVFTITASDTSSHSASADITVNVVSNRTLTTVAVTTNPDKTTYLEGDTLDLTGVVVTATYDDSSTTVFSEALGNLGLLTFIPNEGDTLTTSETSVLVYITSEGDTIFGNFDITVNAKTYVAYATSAEELFDGQKVYIGNGTDKAWPAYSAGNNIKSVSAEYDGELLLCTDTTSAIQYTIGRVGIKLENAETYTTYYYFSYESGGNVYYLRDNASADTAKITATTTRDDNCLWTIDVDSTTGECNIVNKGNTNKQYMRINSENLSCYTDTFEKPKLYVVTDYSEQEVADSFEINRLHMLDYDEELGYCKDSEHAYYAKAKEVWNAMSEDEKLLVSASGTDRLSAWAAANGDVLNSDLELVAKVRISIFGTPEQTNNTIIIVVISVVSLSAIGGYFLLRKKKED